MSDPRCPAGLGRRVSTPTEIPTPDILDDAVGLALVAPLRPATNGDIVGQLQAVLRAAIRS
jgi:hypothetical protein